MTPPITSSAVSPTAELAIKLVNITKRFPGVVANDHVSFDVRGGEIHALLGENGAGKSTLMSILAGLYQPDEGQIFVWGKQVKFRSPADAIAVGIGMVWQHFKLVPTLTVAENVALGVRRPLLRLKLGEVEKKLEQLSAQYGLEIEPKARIYNLSVGEQQRIEIIRSLYYGVQILILDEPTANLTPQEASSLFKVMRNLAAQSYAIVFISHKLAEVSTIADRATILRRGQTITTLPIQGHAAEKHELARLMLNTKSGEVEPDLAIPQADISSSASQDLLGVENITVRNEQGRVVVQNLSLNVRAGEIFTVIGVAGNGQRELAETLAGLRKVASGHIFLDGKEISQSGPRLRSRLGLAFVPEDRLHMGVAAGLNLVQNSILRSYWQPTLQRFGFVRYKVARQQLEQTISQYDVRIGTITAPIRLLSGGNLQKLLLARELSSTPKVLIVANPTRGLDIGATEFIRKQLLEQCDKGAAVLLITEDLDEALAIGTRVAVMFNGIIQGVTNVNLARQSLDQISLWMTGASNKQPGN